MSLKTIRMRFLSLFLVFSFVIPWQAMAQETVQTAPAANFSKEELAQMLAPIALYPDSLLAQILMASTYPLEVVEADRWLQQNRNLNATALDDAVRDKNWDPSVKSLTHFPDVLSSMSQNLDRTEKLGEAFLAQEPEVMDTVQQLRRKAQAQGNLTTNKEQKVIVEQDVIKIEPVQPDVIYVPVYNPTIVYGPWWYPAYPPYYWYYPAPVIVSGVIGFGAGIFVGLGISTWSFFDWPHHRIYVDRARTLPFNRFAAGRPEGREIWRHEIQHRRGVAYMNRSTSLRFRQAPGFTPERRSEARGFMERRLEQPGRTVGRGFPERREGRGAVPGGVRVERPQGAARGGAFSGIGEGRRERAAGERGFSSRQHIEGGRAFGTGRGAAGGGRGFGGGRGHR